MDDREEIASRSPPEPAAVTQPQPAAVVQPQPAAVTQLPSRAELDAGKVQLVTRLLVGILTSGSGELLSQLEDLQRDILYDPDASRPDYTEVISSPDAARYLAISLLLRGERAIAGGIRSGVEQSVAATRWTFRTLDRLTDNRLMRPVRRPFTKRSRSWSDRIALLIEEGQREEQNSKVLASESMGVIIDGVVEIVVDNPELDHLVGEIIGQKGTSLASVMADNTRTLTATGDDVAEGILRKLLRRTPRRSLAPSPVEGESQTMYSANTLPQRVDQNDG